MHHLVKKTLAALALAAACGASMASTSTYSFGTYFTGAGPQPSQSFATLSVTTDAFNKTFDFYLEVKSNLSSIFGDGAYVSALTINTLSGADPLSSSIGAGTWGVSTVSLNTEAANTGGTQTSWDFVDSFCITVQNTCNNNNANKSEGLGRLTAGESVKWTTTFQDAQTPLFGDPSMILKVQGYKYNGADGSAEYTPTAPIPEPETYAMMLAGLGLMGIAGSRRRRKLA